MRIVDEFAIGAWKCTVFIHQQHFTVKIEDGPLRQEYRLPAGQEYLSLNRIKDHFTTTGQVTELQAVFNKMRHLLPALPKSDDEFDEII